MAAGGVACIRCGLDIDHEPEPEPWELDHADEYAPAHKLCNRSAGGRSA